MTFIVEFDKQKTYFKKLEILIVYNIIYHIMHKTNIVLNEIN